MKKIQVFLSRPNPFLIEHQAFLDSLQAELDKYDIETITLQADDYDLTDSMNYLKGMIKHCYGIIIVGFKQIFIDVGSKKKGAVKNEKFYKSKEYDFSNTSLTSPFCHIEGPIGIIYDLPILIINEDGITEDGILMGGRYSTKAKKFNIKNVDQYFADPDVQKQLCIWVGKVMEHYLFLDMRKT